MINLKKEILGIVLKHIPKDNCVIFLFGSLAQNKIYPSSDIDIGIVCPAAVSNSVLVRIKEDLAKVKTLRDIDVVDFSEVKDKTFLKTALREVELWHQTRKSKVYFSNLKKRIRD